MSDISEFTLWAIDACRLRDPQSPSGLNDEYVRRFGFPSWVTDRIGAGLYDDDFANRGIMCIVLRKDAADDGC